MTSLWASFLLSSEYALADDSPTQKVQSANSAARSDVQSDAAVEATPARAKSPEQQAAIAYQAALTSYAKGDVHAALDSMRESYRLSKRAELLYNVAQLEDELNACSDALADYRQYLELVPHGRYRDSAEQARQRLEQLCPPKVAATKTAAISVAPSEAATTEIRRQEPALGPTQRRYWTTPRVIGWSAIAAGTLTGATALYFQLEAIEAKHEFQHSYDNASAGGPAVDMSLQDRQHRYNHVAIALGVTAGAMVTSGVLLVLLDPGNSGQHLPSASLYVLPGLIGASYTQRF